MVLDLLRETEDIWSKFLYFSHGSILFLYGYYVPNGRRLALGVSCADAKKRKDMTYFVRSFHVQHRVKKRLDMCFINSELAKVLLHRVNTTVGLSKQEQYTRFWEVWDGPFNVVEQRRKRLSSVITLAKGNSCSLTSTYFSLEDILCHIMRILKLQTPLTVRKHWHWRLLQKVFKKYLLASQYQRLYVFLC